jgi:hypothetical protein
MEIRSNGLSKVAMEGAVVFSEAVAGLLVALLARIGRQCLRSRAHRWDSTSQLAPILHTKVRPERKIPATSLSCLFPFHPADVARPYAADSWSCLGDYLWICGEWPLVRMARSLSIPKELKGLRSALRIMRSRSESEAACRDRSVVPSVSGQFSTKLRTKH